MAVVLPSLFSDSGAAVQLPSQQAENNAPFSRRRHGGVDGQLGPACRRPLNAASWPSQEAKKPAPKEAGFF
jgi:hypothetical protein